MTLIPPCTTPKEKIARLALARSHQVGAITFVDLLRLFGSASEALRRLPELAARGGARRIVPYSLGEAEQELQRGEKDGATLVVRGSDAYPTVLNTVSDAPPVLWVKGQVQLLKQSACGFVGTRNASAAGLQVAARMAQQVGEAGYITVSGLARGIDTAVHKASLTTGTIAVVAGGLDIIYPPENAALYQNIAQQGVLISEMPHGTEPIAKLFPRRNRIIAGLGLALVVAEAALKSGSLITAHYALDYGRDVLAIPGSPADPRAEGPNRLIQQGAQLVHTSADVLRVLEPLAPLREEHTPVSQALYAPPSDDDMTLARNKVLALLTTQGVPVDVIIRLSMLPTAAVQMVLLELDLAGRLDRGAGNTVALLPNEMALLS